MLIRHIRHLPDIYCRDGISLTTIMTRAKWAISKLAHMDTEHTSPD